MAVHALKKITVRDVMKGKPEKHKVTVTVPDPADEKKTIEVEQSHVKAQDVCIIYGRAHSHETGSTQYGPYTTFIGSFEARRVKDGEIFQSSRIIFPPIADGLAIETYMGAKAEDPTAQIDFAFVVGVEHDPRGAEGYRFTCKPVNVGNTKHDPLAELRASLSLNFAEALGIEGAQALGLIAPGDDAKQITGPAATKEPAPAKAK